MFEHRSLIILIGYIRSWCSGAAKESQLARKQFERARDICASGELMKCGCMLSTYGECVVTCVAAYICKQMSAPKCEYVWWAGGGTEICIGQAEWVNNIDFSHGSRGGTCTRRRMWCGACDVCSGHGAGEIGLLSNRLQLVDCVTRLIQPIWKSSEDIPCMTPYGQATN